jgi:stage II sporulation protein D
MVISGKDFRNIMGPNDIRSNLYEVVMRGYYIDFYGRGWGHGVGLCQWGALGMAQLHFDYKAILKHYYPGIRVEHLDKI